LEKVIIESQSFMREQRNMKDLIPPSNTAEGEARKKSRKQIRGRQALV
jgi:hypothetical protein